MLFPSHEFLFYFLPLLLAVYYAVPDRSRRLLLVVGSYFFYGWFDPRMVSLLLVSTVVDYLCGGRIHATNDPRRKKRFLTLSILINLGLLGFFKYFMFANRSLGSLFAVAGVAYPDALLSAQVVLPIGISFFTFQSMSYTIDIYRGKVRPAANLIDFACYIAMFPQLIAGPIVRYSAIADQLRRPVFNTARFYLGLQFFVIGLAKKVLLADNLAPLAEAFYDAESFAVFSSLDVVTATIAYSLQIYFDFSGYSDMAVGLGYFLGYKFPQNFASPYKSASISELWRRWHITLSEWLRDYLYIPLGGSRGPRWAVYRNLGLTMLLGGLWHGANWTYVLWGAWQGLWLMIERPLGGRSVFHRAPRIVQVVWLHVVWSLGWLLFRAADLTASGKIFGRLVAFDLTGSQLLGQSFRLPLVVGVIGLVVAFGFRNSWEISERPTWMKSAGLALLFLLSAIALFGSVVHPFLYFQF
ncbi:MAG: MBOAT family O-acyltransferase [Candidatus Lernaella stagnicola]|nr:MBOAT family O-acyltransferase [Candidatus Lernaella stagnicola]